MLWVQWAGGLGAPVALGTPMAMAEQPRPGWASYHGSNTNNCQDLGNSILLLLGLIICINISINMVTLLWRRLRDFLHQVFHIVYEKEASKSSSPRKQPERPKQSVPAVHLHCTMDPVKMTVTPPPSRRHRHRGSSGRRAHRPVARVPDTDDDEKPPYQHPAVCSHHWDQPVGWPGFQSIQGFWVPWPQDAVEPPPQTIRFQQTVEGRPLKGEMRSELGLEAYVYPVNPPPPSTQALNHKNSGVRTTGAQAQPEPCAPAPAGPPPVHGPAHVPDIPRRRSSGRVVYDAPDVRRRLRELTREVEALSHCYPLGSPSSNAAEGTGKDWVYRSVIER